MDFFQVQDLFKQMHPGKNIDFEFDKSCIRIIELIYTDGFPNPVHHVEYQKIKITPEGMPSIYVNIMPHRENWMWEKIQKHINE